MNEVSIIINGVRYDSHAVEKKTECKTCDLYEFCEEHHPSFGETCSALLSRGYNFKKSYKKFEK
jgi:hypothetical protein